MADIPETKDPATHHVEDSHKRASLEDVILQREQRDADELQEKYDLPVKEALESHLDQDPETVRKIMRKVDLRLVPILSLLYMWAFIDRSNLGNVRDAPSLIHVLWL
jgi:hypothetical protein